VDEWAGNYTMGTLVMTGIGALVGWATDAANSRSEFHYARARAPLTTLHLVPMGGGGKGLALVVAF
jgi:hypothetical protein